MARGFEVIGVVGGDADAAAVAQAAAEAGPEGRVAVALIPSRRSDLLEMFALEKADTEAGLRRMLEGTRYPADLGIVEGSFGHRAFINSVVAGAAVSGGPWSRRRGTVTVSTRRDLEVDGAGAVMVMNGQKWRGRTAAPRATLVDGVADVLVVVGGRRVLAEVERAMSADLHLRAPWVVRRRAASARIEVPRGWWVAVDEVRLGRGPFTISILPAAVDLLI